ncbi:RNA polymerase sigma factor [Mucilaginibacter dorajii]|uniref:RNA polymerase sigma-70 factor n=1 Tax=Mucilaginibacter dorajii TaxID=692994 RepID=A0ABP7QYM7_9SPHI|nr:RNA polymerase sigma-70 factor [Mucilaginibacter dorajii]MCS3732303.1 RNA polymerase sigma-70 factor (ECF subfamily) [Mucilaginibacter dorajii]
MSAYSIYTDQELITFLAQGDDSAYTEIYNRHWKFLFQAAYRANRNKEDSYDICQGVFLWIWENRAQIRPATNLKGYLYTAAKYKIANMIRNGKYRESLFEDLEIFDKRSYEVNELEIKELKNFIAQLIDELPDKCREVFLLSRKEHLSHKQIAERLDIGEKTVDSHIARALQKLRAPLNRLASIFLMI